MIDSQTARGGSMKVLRTPDERFHDLPDYPFAPHCIEIEDRTVGVSLRQHYVAEGDPEGRTVLLMHGEPSWSYLYRHIIPILADAGFRVIAPDLIGFGKSDKPADKKLFTYRRHVQWMQQFLETLDVRDAVLFCQDWGGLIGLRLVADNPDRFAGVIASNTALPTGEPMPKAFMNWRAFARWSPWFKAGAILNAGSSRTLSEAERSAYDAPFPDKRYMAAARAFPLLVPITPDDPGAVDNRAAWQKLAAYRKPFLTLFGDKDPVTAGVERKLQATVPGARGQPHEIVQNAAHFIQGDAAPLLADRIVRFAQSLEG